MKSHHTTPQYPSLHDERLTMQEANVMLHFKKFLCGNTDWIGLRESIRRTLAQGGDDNGHKS